MSNILINIALDFSDAPGARYYDDGDDSGEEFYEKLLKDKFIEAKNNDVKLIVNLDGTFGYATSFISEAFGRLSNDFGASVVRSRIEIISDEDPEIRKYTFRIISDPNFKGDFGSL